MEENTTPVAEPTIELVVYEQPTTSEQVVGALIGAGIGIAVTLVTYAGFFAVVTVVDKVQTRRARKAAAKVAFTTEAIPTEN